MLLGGFWSTIVNLSLFIGARYVGYSDQHAMTMTFVSLVLIEFFKAYAYSIRPSTCPASAVC